MEYSERKNSVYPFLKGRDGKKEIKYCAITFELHSIEYFVR